MNGTQFLYSVVFGTVTSFDCSKYLIITVNSCDSSMLRFNCSASSANINWHVAGALFIQIIRIVWSASCQ